MYYVVVINSVKPGEKLQVPVGPFKRVEDRSVWVAQFLQELDRLNEDLRLPYNRKIEVKIELFETKRLKSWTRSPKG
jgi:hypothetical protein